MNPHAHGDGSGTGTLALQGRQAGTSGAGGGGGDAYGTGAGERRRSSAASGGSEESINVYELLNEEQVAEFKEAFSLFDKNGDGSITTGELGTVMRHLGQDPSEEELTEMINKIDVDGDGTIDFEEYLQMMCMQMKTRDSEDEILSAMRRMFDTENTGYISQEQLKIILMGLEEDVTDAEIKEIQDEVDVGGGMIDYALFVRMMLALAPTTN